MGNEEVNTRVAVPLPGKPLSLMGKPRTQKQGRGSGEPGSGVGLLSLSPFFQLINLLCF